MLGTHSTYKKLAVRWLHEALCFVSSSVVADSFVLRNRQLLVAANRWWQVPFQIVPHLVKLNLKSSKNEEICHN